MPENQRSKSIVHIVTNNDFFYLLFKTFIQKVAKDCSVEKVELIQETYLNESFTHDQLPQLIIVDANITGISPIDLLNTLRTELRFTMQIWFVTEISARQYLSKIMDVGANLILFKPFDPEKLAIQIVDLIKTKHTYEPNF